MRILKKQFKHRKLLFISLAAIFIIVAGATTYVYGFKGNIFGWSVQKPNDTSNPNKSHINYDKPTNDQKKAGEQTADTSKQNAENSSQGAASSVGNSKKSVNVLISALAQNGSMLQIRTLISTITNTGICTLTLTKVGSSTVTKTAETQTLPSSTTCKGFDVPVSELSNGQWNVSVAFENDSLTGTATQTVEVHQ
jgi:hypothetical protein